MNIALFGGSFNPIHKGHIKLIEAVSKGLDIDKFIIMPTAVSPHKSNNDMALDMHRYEMCKIACNCLDFVEVSDWEINQKNKSYTYLTIEYLKNTYPEDNLFLVVGADMFMCFEKWKNFSYILKNASLITVPRDDISYNTLAEYGNVLNKYGTDCYIFKNSVMDVSSTQIRNCFKNNKDISRFLDKEVAEYIKKNNLYGSDIVE